MLKGKHILLGITGSIAAYKAAILVRLLVKEGAEVKIVMTKMAKEFISPLTMATLSKNPILVDFYNPENGDWNSHVSLGLWADLYLIAPASANTLAKMATGVADNLLLTSYLSSRCPVAIAPAMDLDMFLHPATQHNLELLNKRGVLIIEPSSGELASGLEGKGRMEEPEVILAKINTFFSKKKSKPFFNKKVIVTAGPTVEQIDPVRFISNHSTGKMGYAIAQEFAEQGAEVVVVSGPVQIPVPKGVKVINVQSAQQMFQQTMQQYQSGADIVVLSAAVSDYTSANQSQSKLKRDGETLHLQLIPTQDIAASLGKIKKDGSVHIGFALETDNEQANAIQKMQKKNLDAIVLNSLNDKGAGFATNTNKITIFTKEGKTLEFPLKSKSEVAKDIIKFAETLLPC
ncbi:MAG: bifunctional phosphopantothenoylcysteine decarboxylase/phosphopantothenate--cysteine ligase CoaBC [Bacteroidales bacterium]|nr:bifunctional phosphopantothenoylcysteine decarboxylase/phosphopantothenate--cysteine ligase CoaBC [Bacteroidales bacterium]MDD3299559.1 bifunctional phosphopantothenoylcysteine decarboxylase/phosphopantothenate--cysteine ligase CoaBC [Bacteroidales bacterium]MDD3843899.1 bifunctional phosphopantothenoylcysteine decarboxylase/phosphopantothenate--cysteine ligase CoaBC [Bacteroidales bacterium]MDD4618167.1 bifunctional phosphopantothenoylcysteine decarboxylase/phosphopantothenate--cysteine liga